MIFQSDSQYTLEGFSDFNFAHTWMPNNP